VEYHKKKYVEAKRLVIGAIVLLVIGVAAYMLSQPRKGTVEYHKVEFLRATKLGPMTSYLEEMGVINDPKRSRREFHRQQLLKAGYLTTATFVISNRPLHDAFLEVWAGLSGVLTAEEEVFVDRRWKSPDMIIVVAPNETMKSVEGFIRKLDVPETK
jgi:hypothetical protein